MAYEKKIEEEITQLSTLKILVAVYEEIASRRMKKTRDSVLRNRDFLKEINEIFEQVRLSYAHEVSLLAKKRGKPGKEKITFLAHNAKAVAVLLSANTGLYGEIIPKTFRLFIDDIRREDLEITLVGRYGRALFISEEPERPFTYFDLPDHGMNTEQMNQIIKHIVQYEEIRVYYGEFINIVKQIPDKLTISAEMSLKEGGGPETLYLFEPSLENILMFFETEIFASLFDQAIREGQLAKFASRVMAMEKANENIKKDLSRLHNSKLRAKHLSINRKQVNSLASVLATK